MRVLLGVFAAVAIGFAATHALAAARPNIIFLMADDMGLGDVGVYDAHSTIPTPSMDQMAADGLRFTDAHSPASACTPTRYAVLTGRFPFRSSLNDRVLRSAYDEPLLTAAHETVPALLKRAGYRTAAFGKWHLGMTWSSREAGRPAKPGVGTSQFSTRDVDFARPILDGPRQHGFDYFFGVGSSMNHGPYTFIKNERVAEIPDRFRKETKVNGRPFREGWIAPSWDDTRQDSVVADRALRFISEQAARADGSPFFLYYASLANHWPHSPPTEFRGHPIRGRGGRDDGASARNDMVVHFDVILGLLRARLDDPNQDGDQSDSIAGNTLLIVTSDNGADVGHYRGIRGKKGDIYEGGHRVPLLVAWPGHVQAGQVSDRRVSLIDLYASLAALTGTAAAENAAADSRNALPALLGTAEPGWSRGPLLQQKLGTGRTFALLDGPWKLIVREGEPEELYRLDRDLAETRNLVDDAPQVVEKMMDTVRALKK